MIPNFRAWDKRHQKMFNVSFIDFDTKLVGLDIDLEIIIFDFDDIILMQSTGQKDCNNSDIFDADILLEPWTGRIVGRVFYSLGDLAWKVLLVGGGEEFLSDCLDSEVCGNIHENPDLMEELNDQ